MDDNDFTVTDESDGQPVQTQSAAPAHDVASIVAQTTEAIMAKLAPLLQRSEPQQPAKPRDPLLDALKQHHGIEDDDEAKRYAKSLAYRELQDEYGQDPAVKKYLQSQIDGARGIESMASMRRQMQEFMQKIEGRFSEQEQARKRADEAAAYKRLASEGQLAEQFPNLFRKGRPSQAALEIFDQFSDVDSLRKALAIAEKVAAEQQPRKPQIAATGGRATNATKPSKFYDGADYDAQIRRMFETGEVN